MGVIWDITKFPKYKKFYFLVYSCPMGAKKKNFSEVLLLGSPPE